jgi:NitT/TauT family transport system substrate-binding protein
MRDKSFLLLSSIKNPATSIVSRYRLMTSKLSLILLLLIPLTLASCTRSDTERNTIRLAYLQTDLHHLPAFIALEKGFYLQEGLSVEVSGIFRAGPELMSGFSAGNLDVGYVGLSPATVAVANKIAQVKVVSQINKNGSALIVKKNAPFNNLAALKGKTIAIPGHSTIQDFLLRKAILNFNLKEIQMNIITIKPPEMIGALSGNSIDAFISWEPYPSMSLTREIGRVLMNSSDIWRDHPCCVMVVNNTFLKNNPSKVRALRSSHITSINYINNNRMEAVSIGVKYTGMDSKTVEMALRNIQFDHQISSSQVVEYIQFLNKLSYTSISNPQTFATSFLLKSEE